MPSIKARITALTAQLHSGHATTPYEDLDPISKALVDLVNELEALDTPEKKAAYCEEHSMDLDQLEGFIRGITVDY